MPGEDTHVQAIRGPLETEHSKAFVDIILVLCPLIGRVCKIGIRTSVDVCVDGTGNVSVGICQSSQGQ